MDDKNLIRAVGIQLSDNYNAELLRNLEIVEQSSFNESPILFTGSNLEAITDLNKNAQVQIMPQNFTRHCFIENGADENLIAIPLNLLQVNGNINQPLQTYVNPQHPKRAITSTGDGVIKQCTSLPQDTPDEHVVIKSNSNLSKNYFLSPFSVSNFNEQTGISVIDGSSLNKTITAETVVGGGQVFLHLEESPGTQFKPDRNNGGIGTDILLATGNFKDILSDKQLSQVTLLDDQVLLNTSGEHLEDSLIVCRETMNGAALNSVITPSLEKDSIFDENIPDEQTITVDSITHSNSKDMQSWMSKKGPWKCGKCDLTFCKVLHFKKHILEHVLEKPFKCGECSDVFSSQNNLKLHVVLHDRSQLVCPECGKRFRRYASFKAHLPIHEEDEISSCSVCGEEFFSSNQLKSHALEHWVLFRMANVNTETSQEATPVGEPTANHFECIVCNKSFDNAVTFKNHMGLHRRYNQYPCRKKKNMGLSKTHPSHQCHICNKLFMKPSQLARHIRIHTGEKPFKCTHSGCDRAFGQKCTLLQHMDVHNENREMAQCKECGKTFSQKSNLKHHMLRLHPTNADILSTSFKCSMCSCIFSKANSLNVHIAKQHRVPEIVVSSLDSTSIKALENQIDDYQTKNISRKDKYSFTIGYDNAEQTGKTPPIMNDYNLEDIIKVNHIKDKAYGKDNDDIKENGDFLQVVTLVEELSDKCARKFPVLVRHSKGLKWHVCPFKDCRKEIKKASDLIRHTRTHTNEKPFKCNFCLRGFSSKATLAAHVRIHLSNKEFTCKVCAKSFYAASSLKVHSWIHTGQKPYKCTMCPRQFRTLSQRKNHVLTHKPSAHRSHMLKKRNTELVDVTLREPMMITNNGPVNLKPHGMHIYATDTNAAERPHRCCYCRASFKKSSHLKLHERSHTGERPYKCDMCFKTFSCNSVLKSHLRIHEGGPGQKCNICHKVLVCKRSLKRHLTVHSGARPYLCPYCNKAFKTVGMCKKHIKVHRSELASISRQGLSETGEENVFPNIMIKEENLGTLPSNEGAFGPKGNCLEYGENIQIDTTVNQETINEGLRLVDLMQTQQPADDSSIKTVSDGHIVLPSEALTKMTDSGGMQHLMLSDGTLFTTTDAADMSGNVLVAESGDTLEGTIYEVSADGSSEQTIMLGKNISGTIHDIPFSQREAYASVIGGDKVIGNEQSDVYVIQEDLKMSQGDKNELIASDTEFIYVQHRHVQKVATIPQDDLTVSDQNLVTIIETVDSPTPMDHCDQPNNHDVLMDDSHIFFAKQIEPDPAPKLTKEDGSGLFAEEPGDKETLAFSCPHCPKKFKKECHLSSHSRVHNTNIKQCSKCKQTFPTTVLLKDHMKQMNSSKTCCICHVGFTSVAFLVDHIRNQHKGHCLEGQEAILAEACDQRIWRCPVCTELFKSPSQIKDHLQHGHSEENVNQVIYDKNEPSLMARGEDNQNKNLESFQISSTLVNPNAGRPTRGKRKNKKASAAIFPRRVGGLCAVCNKSFRKSSDLSRHMRVHTGEKPYECGLCGKRFGLKSTMVVHEKSHAGTKTHKCDICNELYATNGSLKIHQRIHTGEKPLKCYFCGQQFRTSSRRKMHMRKHFRLCQQKRAKSDGNCAETEEPTDVGDGKILVDPQDISSENIYTVIVNEDGSLALQLNNSNVDVGNMLNVVRAESDDSDVNPLYTFALELQNDDAVNSIQNDVSLNQNIIAEFDGSKDKDSEVGTLCYSSSDYVHHSQSMQAFSSQTTELANFVDEGAEMQCATCLCTFSKLSDWQEHQASHGVTEKDGKSDAQLFKRKTPSKGSFGKAPTKEFDLPTFSKSFKCQCGKVFKSNSSLQSHRSSFAACRSSQKCSPFKDKPSYPPQPMFTTTSNKKLKGLNLSMKPADEEAMDICSTDMSDILMMND